MSETTNEPTMELIATYDQEALDLEKQVAEGKYNGDGPEDVAAVIDVEAISNK